MVLQVTYARSRLNWPALLALMALAVQLLIGLTHHHSYHAHTPWLQNSHDAGAWHHLALSNAEADHERDHRGDGGDGQDEHPCTICLTLMAIRAALLPGIGEAVVPSGTRAAIAVAFDCESVTRRILTVSHGPRGPPGSALA